MFNLQDAYYAAKCLGVSFEQFTLEEFLEGINIELETWNNKSSYKRYK